ncbi:amino acid adenylation domain-containing protein [Aquimarina sp. ERC-38]|uniref:non-ribosomal peptide synthetase n=1 Tax=Aquimarina sp. ERC-38 TaxID=2949996 RepID=UPI0022459B28|nr:non-ribosomal peptide synthetase [Aquimarina sp. ERC-38]UZO79163.1 amino acid adenylation domain-containing protein [Aquimarina sp. ERC-38]
MNVLNKTLDILDRVKQYGASIFLQDGILKIKKEIGKKLPKAIIEEIKENKEDIILFLQKYKVTSNLRNVDERIVKQESATSTLSYNQEQLWFIDELQGSAHFNMPILCKIKGTIDKDKLEMAIKDVLDRHQILRTIIKGDSHNILQSILLTNHWNLIYSEIIDDNQKSITVANNIKQTIEKPFDLSNDYLLRAHLIKEGEEQYVLVIVVHHIAIDGQSIEILYNEIVACYNNHLKEKKNSLPKLDIQYSDFAIWEKEYFSNQENKQKALEYWKEQLIEYTNLQLPLNKKRPAIQSSKGAVISLNINNDISNQIYEYASQEGVTPYIFLLAVFKVLMAKYSGQNDIVIGSPFANRGKEQLQGLIGCFTNTLPIRSILTPNISFNKFLKEVKSQMLQAYDYQNTPFSLIVKEMIEDRDLSRTPIFQTLFTYEPKKEIVNTKIGTADIFLEDIGYNVSKYDLAAKFLEKENELILSLEYCKDLFEASFIKSMARHYKELIVSTIKDDSILLEALQMLHEDEKAVILKEFSNNDISYQLSEKTFLDKFRTQSKDKGSNISLIFDDRALTYEELDLISNQFANQLRSYKIGKGDFIPICVNRSIEMIVAIFGVLKSGAAYVPVDPNVPLKRLSFILSDMNASVCVIQKEVEKLVFNGDTNVECIYIEDFSKNLKNFPNHKVEESITPEQTAYMIYTSGSTGIPKGVEISHSSLYIYLKCMSEKYQLLEVDRLLFKTNFTFDVSIYELFGWVFTGSGVVIYPSQLHREVEKMINYAKKYAVTLLQMVPSLFAVFIEVLDREKIELPHLKHILLAGEALSPSLVKKYEKLELNAKLVNIYGPTEATVYSSQYELNLSKSDVSYVPIGRPLRNVSLYIVDKNLSLLPVGIIGELCISGPQVAKGYWNRSELTKEKFITNPFIDIPNQKMFRTGDLVRWLPDGNIQFIGRKDYQVKIRGYRIELEEVETHLEQLSWIDKAVALAIPLENGTNKLLAYVQSKEKIDIVKTKNSLYEVLPEYMIPEFFEEIQEYPLSSNGKIDRKSLTKINTSFTNDREYIAPRTAQEKQLLEIWQEILMIDTISVKDNFFALGGDSIMAIQMVSRAKEYGIFFMVKDVLRYRTIERILLIAKEENKVLTEQGKLEGEFSLTPIQHLFFNQQGGSNHYNQSMLLEVDRKISFDVMKKVVAILINKHDSLRLSFNLKKKQGWSQNYIKDKEAILFKERCNSKKELSIVCQKYQENLDITQGEIAKFVWISMPNHLKNDFLFIVVHHLGIDGVSWRILFENMIDSFKIINIEKKNLDDAIKQTSFRQWTNRLIEYADAQKLKAEYDYWIKTLSNVSAMPKDFTETEIKTYKNKIDYKFGFSKKETKELLGKANLAYGTRINDILLSALTLTLTTWSNTPKVVIGLEGHGREELFDDIDVTKTTGWFTSLYPVTLSVPDDSNNLELLIANTKDMIRNIPNQGIGYGILRYLSDDQKVKLNLDIDFSSIIFNYLGDFDTSLDNQNMIKISLEERGEDIGVYNKNPYSITITSLILEQKLNFIWSFDSSVYNKETSEFLIKSFSQNLKKIIVHCCSRQPVKTPSDFGLPTSISFKSVQNFINEDFHCDQVVDIYELSYLQKGMLFHNLLDNNMGDYIIQTKLDFIHGVDVNILEKSWEKIIKQHSVLRTGVFSDYFDIPVQCVYANIKTPLKEVYYNELPEGDDKIEAFILHDRSLGFNLKNPPLFRMSLLHHENRGCTLLITYHHIILDGWSFSLLLNLFMDQYQSLKNNEFLIEKREDEYVDLINQHKSKDIYELKTYWKKYLSPISSPCYLPFIKNTAKRNRVFGNRVHLITLDEALTVRIKDFVKNNSFTISTFLQGAWSFLLSQYTHQESVVFGVTISGRNTLLDRIEERVGLYINTIPVVTIISPERNIIEWLEELQIEHAKGREEFGYMSLSDIQSCSSVQGVLFDNIIVFENYPLEVLASHKFNELDIANIEGRGYGNFALSLSVSILDNSFKIGFTYNEELLDQAIIERICKHFVCVFNNMLSTSKTLGELSYLPESEYHQLLSFNKTFFDYDRGCSLIDSFYDMVVLYSSKTALVFNEESMTYQELYDRSNQLAHCLKSKGANPGDRIGLLSYRGLDMLVSIFGILQTGCVYVPLHAEYPSQRLSYILEDAGVKQLVCTDMDLLSAKGISGLYDIVSFSDLSECPDTPIDVLLCHDSLAYLMYTSGSTGVPKGVKVTHGNIQKLVNDQGAIGVRSSDVVLQWSNYAFDGSVYEIFSCLLSGATLHLINKEEASSAIAVSKLLVERSISVCFLTTALFNALVDYDVSSLSGVRRVLFGGELVSPSHVSRALEVMVPGNLVHVYGPTETVVYATSHQIYAIEGDCVPIGSPLSNTQIYIVNDNFQLCGLGVSGEICIGGEGVSKGYLNKDDVTSSHFVKNPFGSGFLYCTGDLGRWLEDGSIDFIGRRDSQVKIRGYRIELGEVESALQSLPMVDRAIVISDSAPGGGKRLIGYVVGGSDFNKGLLDSQLVNMLPEYMIPSFIIVLDSFPLTPNGKIDRKSLPEPGRDQDRSLDIKQGAYTSIERQLIPIWKEVLKVDGIEPQDNFFDLGGHSILATQLVNKIRNVFTVDIEIKDVFIHDTIATLANFISIESNKTIHILIEIWKDILKLEDISIHDEFFDLGGHSILATQMVTVVRNTFKIDIEIEDIFIYDTIFQLAEFINTSPNDVQKRVAEIWKEILKINTINIHEEFFDLGGHSILATQVVTKVRKEFEIDIELKDVFVHDTIAEFSHFIEDQKSKSTLPKITVQERPEHIPLSYAQERLWFIDKMNGSTHYHIPAIMQLKGTLKINILEDSVNIIINRHQPLRTVFYEYERDYYQKVMLKNKWKIQIVKNIEEEQVPQIINQTLNQPFNLSQDHMLRGLVIEKTKGDYVLIFIFHHIAGDSKLLIFFEELTKIYNAKLKGESSYNLQELPIQYIDYAIWQKKYLRGKIMTEKLSYWKDKLQGISPLELPTDFPRRQYQSTHGETAQITIPKNIQKQLTKLSKEEDVTLFTLMLAAFKVLLYRYSGQKEIVVGTPVANRTVAEVENLIGFFVNALVLRSNIEENSLFTELLQQVKENTLSAYQYQDVPFERVVENIDIERDESRTPIFQIMFTLQNNKKQEEFTLGNTTIEPHKYDYKISKYDLTFTIIENNENLQLHIEYCSDLFMSETIENMGNHYVTLLKAIISDKNTKINKLNLLSDEEKNTLLSLAIAPKIKIPKEVSIFQLFNNKVVEYPNKIALRLGESSITYQELWERSNQLANCLIEKGVSVSEHVGILMERGMDMIISIFGVLQCGAVYVPLHTDYPAKRIKYILNDAKISKVITNDKQLINQKEVLIHECIDIVESMEYIKKPIAIDYIENELAYIMYTSGTTGKPKGVCVTHKNVIKLVYDQGDIAVDSNDNVLQWSNFAFDGSVYEIFSALLKGATLHLIEENQASDAAQLSEVISNQKITISFMTTALFNAVVDYDVISLKKVRKLLFGGESVSVPHARKALNVIGPNILIHVYGPTETVVFATFHTINEINNEKVPIGKPLSNTSAHIVDEQGQVCPIGIVGELLIGGDGVSSGYLGKPALTEEKFVDNILNLEDLGKLYRTGDLVKRLPNGDINFIGRKDNQVKIRGYRIELGEIEEKLEEIKEIEKAVVLVDKSKQTSKRLIAYVISNKNFDKLESVKKMKEKLPDYMIPKIYVEMDVFPLNTNGKIDKAKFPKPQEEAFITQKYIAPRNDMEKSLHEIWSKILNIDKIGVQDNFFELGGYSILATRLTSTIRDELQIDITIKSVFAHCNIEELARYMGSLQNQTIDKIKKTHKVEKVALSFSQERLWFIDQLEGSVQYHMPFIFNVCGNLDVNILEQSFKRLILRHEILRTIIKEEAGIRWQEIRDIDQFRLERITLEVHSDEVTSYIQQCIIQPFDLSEDYMIRVKIIGTSDQKYTLFMMLHHIVSDGWSMPILFEELSLLYQTHQQEQETCLQPLEIQYADYSAWQQESLSGEKLNRKLTYWTKKLAGVLPLELPTDYTRPPVQSIKGSQYTFSISKEVTEKLYSISKIMNASLFMTLLASYKLFLYRYSGQKDICVGTPVANRGHKEIEPLIGFFINTLALRSQIDKESDFISFLETIKHETLEAFEHEDIPFEKIVEKVVRERDQSRPPLFQTMFSLQNIKQISNTIHMGDIILELEPFHFDIAKYDLSFTAVESNDQLDIAIEYCTDLYKESTIKRMAKHYTNLLTEIANNPNKNINTYQLLSQEEEEKIIVDFNQTIQEFPKNETIIGLFQKQVEENPDKEAIIFEDTRVTFLEFNNQVCSYAAYLNQKEGINPKDKVLVTIPHHQDLLAILLAIKQIGAIYIPLDPDTTKDMITYVQNDSQCSLVIQQEFVDLMNEEVKKNEYLWQQQQSEDSDFIIYTSGSTGKPKGVLLKASNVLNRMHWMWENYAFKTEERCCAKTSISFVDHIWELFGPILKGIPLVFYNKEQILDIPEFIVSLEKEKVSRIVLVPSLLKALLEYPELCKKKLRDLCLWICSGETLKKSLVEQFYATVQNKEAHLLNIYGSSEVAADATYFDTYKLFNTYKELRFSLFEDSIEKRIEELIYKYDNKQKITSSSFSEILKNKTFSDVSLESQVSLTGYTEFIETIVSGEVPNISSRTYIGHMTGPIPKLFRELGALLTTMNQNQVKIETSMAASLIERQVIGKFHNLVYKKNTDFYSTHVQNADTCLGICTNGGTISNISALSYALNYAFRPKGDFKGIVEEGLIHALHYYEYKKVVILGSSWCHYSIQKTLKLLGLGKQSFIEVDFSNKTKPELEKVLKQKIEELSSQGVYILSIIGVAGTTEGGNIEPLVTLGSIALDHNIHFHVDAAYGGAALMDDHLSAKLSGIELADSVTICAHKQLYLPIGASLVLFKDPELATFSENNTQYQARKGSYDLGKFTIEGSRSFMSFMLHATLNIYGKEGFAEVIRHNYENAQKFAKCIDEHPSFELWTMPDLTIVLYRYIPKKLRGKSKLTTDELITVNELNQKIQKEQFAQGNTFVSYTNLRQSITQEWITVFRAVFMNPYSTEKEFLEVLKDQEKIALQLQQIDYKEINISKSEQRVISIGKPISNVNIYILDENLNITPIGVSGEIYVSGEGVASGYINLPTQTSECFIKSPFNKDQKLFKTGDIARWLDDGNIDFVGRADHQVKIRGYRIELQEIENQLEQLSQVVKALVAVKEDQENDKKLIAYLIIKEPIDKTVVRASLKEVLPEYMIPAAFVILDEFPLASNGKINRILLPDPEVLDFIQEEYVMPSTGNEIVLETIWKTLLEIKTIGIHDNFFIIGGHSLLATRLISKLKSEYGIGIPIKTIFNYPTIHELAKFLDILGNKEDDEESKELETTFF